MGANMKCTGITDRNLKLRLEPVSELCGTTYILGRKQAAKLVHFLEYKLQLGNLYV